MITPMRNPRMIEERLLDIASYIINLVISSLVIPMALRTPNSHIESLMFADIVTMS